jgi:hypothetical protein
VSGITETAASGFPKGFKATTNTATYTYDANGNMTRDNHKKMGVAYNHLNLPKTATFDVPVGAPTGTLPNVITWLYDAAGNKLRKTLSSGGVTDYLGGVEYAGGALEAIYHTEGRCIPSGSTYRYEYNLRDHLGNTRVTFADLNNDGAVTPAEILQENHYYPFGANIEGLTSAAAANKYQYNGKEWNADFGLDGQVCR